MANGVRSTIALEFLQSFSAGNLETLGRFLADDFHLKGPLLECSSKQAYLDQLKRDGLAPASHRIVTVTEGPDSVAVFYEYMKDNAPFMIAQWFRFRDMEIIETLLVFDTSFFSP